MKENICQLGLVLCAVWLVISFTSGDITDILQDSWTCANITEFNLTSLEYCAFKSAQGEEVNETTFIVCEVLSENKRYNNVITYNLYVHTRLTFQMMPPDNCSGEEEEEQDPPSSGEEPRAVISRCVGYRHLIIEKLELKEAWRNATMGTYAMETYFLLNGLDRLLLELNMVPTVPVGVVDLQRDCWELSNRSSSCIRSVAMLRDALTMDPTATPMEGSRYFHMLKEVYVRVLHARVYGITVVVNTALVSALQPDYVTTVVSNSGLIHGHFAGSNWPHMGLVVPELPSLLVLEMPDNHISYFDPGNFLQIPNLVTLNLANNNLSSIPETIATLRSLVYLDLSGNAYMLADEEKTAAMIKVLTSLPNLKTLSLAKVEMKNLSVLYSALATAQLQVLNLSFCGIESIASETLFHDQRALEVLDLSDNRLSGVPGQLVSGLARLASLHLAANLLPRGPRLLLGNHTLALLDLSGNLLKQPGEVLLSGTVRRLDLSGNHIQAWADTGVFSRRGRPWLSCLDLSRNNMTSVSRPMGASLDDLAAVDFGGNPINCDDCRTPEFQKWLQNASVTVLNLGSHRQLTCTQPPKASGLPVSDVAFDAKLCADRTIINLVNYPLVVGVPLAAIFLLAGVFGGAIYRYRFELTYILKRGVLWKKKRSTQANRYDYDAFVSYSRFDRPWVVRQLAPNLERGEDRYRLCLHERDFPLGSLILENIEDGLHRSRHIILVLSENFLKSKFCQWELNMANHKLFDDDHDFLILVELERLDRDALPRRLKFLMDTQTYLEWSAEVGDAVWGRLRAALGTSLHNTARDERDERDPLLGAL